MRRFGIGLAIGFMTFLVGMVPYFLFEGLFRVSGGLSDCVVRMEPSAKYSMPSGGEVSGSNDDSRAVYATVLEDEMYGRAYIVVGDTTTPTDWFAGLNRERQLAGVEKETFDGYSRRNSVSIDLRPELTHDPRVHFIDFGDSSEIFKTRRNGWAEFRKRFPSANGLLTFSTVGFNLARTQALVSVERQCGGLCGDGKFVLLKKVNGLWMILRKINAWKS